MKQEDTNQNTMNIQWYPGHMTKTRRMIEEDVKLVDAMCEILDARIPIASRNPDIDAICGNKPRMIVLNRIDMADPALTKNGQSTSGRRAMPFCKPTARRKRAFPALFRLCGRCWLKSWRGTRRRDRWDGP